jgi:hypothetical protein
LKAKLIAISKAPTLLLPSDAATLAVILQKAKAINDPDEAAGLVERSIAAQNVPPTTKQRLASWHLQATAIGAYTTSFLDTALAALVEVWEIDLSRSRPALQSRQTKPRVNFQRKPGEPLFDTTIETSFFK